MLLVCAVVVALFADDALELRLGTVIAFLFVSAMLKNEPIKVFNHGNMKRDFTFIDDIVAGVVATADRLPQPDPAFDRMNPSAAASWAPYRVFNIGHSQPVALMDFIGSLEEIGRAHV